MTSNFNLVRVHGVNVAVDVVKYVQMLMRQTLLLVLLPEKPRV